MSQRRIGAFFDGGTVCGLAVMGYELDFPLLHHETFLSGKGSFGRRALRIDKWVQGVIDKWRPKGLAHIGFEAPFAPTGPSAHSARFPIGVALKFEEVAERNGIPCSEAVTSTIKKHLTGNGHAKKPEMIRAAFTLGYPWLGEHEADALAVGRVCIDNWLRGR